MILNSVFLRLIYKLKTKKFIHEVREKTEGIEGIG